MKKNVSTLIILSAGLVFGLSSCNANVESAIGVKADGWSSFTIQDISFGDVVDIPSLTYTEGGKTYQSSVVVTFPDGSEQMGTKVSFNQAGEYLATFTVNVNGAIYCKEEKFFINYPQYYVGDPSKSSLKYINSSHLSEINSNTEGALVNLAFGDTLYFSKPFNVSELTSSNVLLRCFVVPTTNLSSDFGIMTFTLTNVDDPSNFVKIRYYSHIETNSNGSVSHSSSVMARSDLVGNYAGVHQSQGLHTNDNYGTWSGCTFDGYVQPSYKSAYYDTCPMVIGFDNETKQVYGTGFSMGKTLDKVLDLDDPSQVSKTWAGFTSDRVTLSITCDSYTNSTANFVITDIYGVEKSEAKNELRDNIFVDEDAPVISLDDKYQTLPNGALGYHYPIPTASAYDSVSKECPVTSEVFFNYFDKDNMTKVKVNNGYFDLEKAGVYTILYTAKDRAGNTSTLAKSVNVLNSISKPSFALPTHEETLPVGSFVSVDRNISVTGGAGEKELKVYYADASGKRKEVTSDGFRIEKLEDYTVFYEATDIIGQVTTLQYNIHVTNMTSPILEREVSMPKYLISKGYYEVPTAYAYTYENGQLVKNPVTLELTDSNGVSNYSSGKEYQPIVTNNNDTVTLKLKLGDTVLQTNTVTVIKSTGKDGKENYLNLDNYFVSQGCEKTLRPNTDMFPNDEVKGMYLKATSEAGFSYDFANGLLGNNFSITVSDIKNVKAGTRVKFIISDYYDSNNSVAASLYYDGTSTYLEVNSQRVKLLDNNMNRTDSFYLTFDGTSFNACYDNVLPVKTTEQGNPFTGFSSYKANFRMEVTGGTSSTNLVVNDLGGYIFSSTAARDRTSPMIYSPNEMGGTKKIGDTYITSPSYSCDVLSPNIIFTLTVKDSKDQPVTDVNGVTLQNVDPTKSYEFRLDHYDVFTIELTTKEDSRFLSSPNTYVTSRYIHVYDDIKPTITMKETLPSEVKVGTTVRFPSFTFSDNITPNDQLIVQKVYIDPKGTYHYLSSNENSIAFSLEGKYKVMIHVMDEAGNISSVYMYVNAVK